MGRPQPLDRHLKPGVRRPARAWFLRIASVRELLYVCLFVCPPPRLSITSGVMWCDIDPIRLVEWGYSFYMAAVVGIGSGRDVSMYTRRGK